MHYKRLLLITTVAVLAISCRKEGCTDSAAQNYNSKAKKDDGSCTYPTPTPSGYDIPTTYSFIKNGSSSVNYQGQLDRLDMLAEMTVEIKKADNMGVTLNAIQLKNMFNNQNAPFTNTNLNNSTKNLSSKCFSGDLQFYYDLLDSMAVASTSTDTAIQGRKGLLITGSGDPSKGLLVDENGLVYSQIISKGLMGAVFYYQAMEIYLSLDLPSKENTVNEPGQNYTAMERAMDEAFGYFGAPTDFPNPATIGNARYYAEYCNERELDGNYPGINQKMMNAFLKARAAIVAKEYTDRDVAIKIVQDTWETIIGGSAVDELRSSKTQTSLTERMQTMTEGIGFMMALKYKFNGGNSINPPISDYSKIQLALNIIGPGKNLYNITNADIDNVIALIISAFPGGEVK